MQALLIKIPEVAARLGVSRAKVYELIASGTLPAVKVDGCRRVRTCDLEAFVSGLTPVWFKTLCPSCSGKLGFEPVGDE